MRSRRRRRPLKVLWLLATIASMAIVASQPVLGTAWSGWTYRLSMDPHGPEPDTDYCARAGIVNTAVNFGQMRSYNNSGDDCDGPFNTLPAGWMGVNVHGYRNNGFCSSTSYIWTNVATYGWQVSDNLCSNPAGQQEFYTHTYGAAYDGQGEEYYYLDVVVSPKQSY